MKNVIKKKWFIFSVVLFVLLASLVFYSLRILNRNNYQATEVRVSRLNQIPYIGEYFTEIENEDGVKYIEKNTMGVIEILFTGHISNENIKKLYESNQWYYISAKATKDSLGDIYTRFNVDINNYPVSYTQEDVLIDRPLFNNIKLEINYIPSKNCFTGKATIYNR